MRDEGKRSSGVGGWSVSGWVRGLRSRAYFRLLSQPSRRAGCYRRRRGRCPTRLAITAWAPGLARNVGFGFHSLFSLVTSREEEQCPVSLDSPEDGVRNWRYAIPIPLPEVVAQQKRENDVIIEKKMLVFVPVALASPGPWRHLGGREALLLAAVVPSTADPCCVG